MKLENGKKLNEKWNKSFKQWRQKDYFDANVHGRTFKWKIYFWWPESKNSMDIIGKIININDIFEHRKRISFDIKLQQNEYLKWFINTSYATHA